MTGYESKRAAAIAKTIDEVNWLDHEPNGLAQPAQKPVAWLYEGEYSSGSYSGNYFAWNVTMNKNATNAARKVKPLYTAPSQPAQEPVANDRALQLVTYQMNHWRAYALELQERLVKYEGGAPMLLNKEKNT